jgi:uncharacterized membrane protein YjjP (DUF1212 family)
MRRLLTVLALALVGVLAAGALLVGGATVGSFGADRASAETPSPPASPDPSPSPTTTPPPSPTPDPTEPRSPSGRPSDPASPEPTDTTSSATAPSPTATPTADASTPTPGPTKTPTASPTPRPSASTSGPVVIPSTPPASMSATVPLTSAIIAFIVLILVGLLLRELTTVSGASADTEDTVILHPATEDDVLRLMSVAGDALIEAGFDVSDVQSDLRTIASAHGMPEVQVIAMPTALVVSAPSGAGLQTSAVATGAIQLRLHQIETLDDVVNRSRLGLDPRTAVREIRAIRQAPPPFPPLVQLLGNVLATMGLAVLLGSSGPGMVLAGALGVFTGALQLFGLRVPLRYQALVTVTAATGVSLTVFLLARLGWSTDIVPSLIAPLVTLLPGALLTTAVIELASGQMISGAGRLAAGATQLLLLALGIVGPALLVGIPALELTSTKPAFGTLGPWLAVAAFGIGIVVNRCARPRSMGWILIVLYVAYGAQVLGGLFIGGMLSSFVGALAMTPVADLVARQRGGPPAIVSFTPAFWILVPGALGLMGVATLLSGDGTGTGSLLTTVVTMIGIALGVLVGRAISTLIGLRRRGPA